MKKISISILLTLILFLPVGPAFAFTKTSADQTPYLTSNAGNQVDEAILPLQDEQLQPVLLLPALEGFPYLTISVMARFIGQFSLHFHTSTHSRELSFVQTDVLDIAHINLLDHGAAEELVAMFSLTLLTEIVIKVTLTGTANGLGAFFYTVPSGVSVSFSIRF